MFSRRNQPGIVKGVLGVMGVMILLLAACSPAAPTAQPPTSAPPPTNAPAPTNAPPPTTVPPTVAPPTAAPAATTPVSGTTGAAAPKAVTLELMQNSDLGKFITDGDGNTLYLFTKDVPNTSNCYDKCEQSWPPVLPAGDATLKDGLIAALVGKTTRKDGSTQLTYNGWPLYYYAKDQKAGDTSGQAVGKVWWVVSPEGNIIKPSGLQVVEDPKLGKLLADETGKTVYMFTKDTKGTSNCYDKCEVAWPPLLMLGKPTVGTGIDDSKLGSTTRKDGSVQVTYNGMPLYYYEKDQKPGDVTGQNVGTVWFVVGPDGTIIKTAAQ